MTHRPILLLGAGFSRNWGGWLAPEVFEYVLGSPHVDEPLRSLLLSTGKRDFEVALDDLQQHVARTGTPDSRLDNLLRAIDEMFSEMNRGLSGSANYFWSGHFNRTMGLFLSRFDAIFTLNQDTLLEAQYLTGHLAEPGNWEGGIIPGLAPRAEDSMTDWPFRGELTPTTGTPAIPSRMQPYIKLHGSSNWRDAGGGLMIVGGSKEVAIKKSPLLAWNFHTFEKYLSRPNQRLMVIGYSFRDSHVNNAIAIATKTGLKVFLVDPQGLGVLDSPAVAPIAPPFVSLPATVLPCIRGVSRRPLLTTWISDDVERSKLLEFLK